MYLLQQYLRRVEHFLSDGESSSALKKKKDPRQIPSGIKKQSASETLHDLCSFQELSMDLLKIETDLIILKKKNSQFKDLSSAIYFQLTLNVS